jgi:hypothetical protein
LHTSAGQQTFALGPLGQGHVRPTAELIIAESRTHRHEEQDPMSGLALIRP